MSNVNLELLFTAFDEDSPPSPPGDPPDDDDDPKRPPPGAGAGAAGGISLDIAPSPIPLSPPYTSTECSPKDRRSHLEPPMTSTPKHPKQERSLHRSASPRPRPVKMPSAQPGQPKEDTRPQTSLHDRKPSLTPSEKVVDFIPPDASGISEEPQKDEPKVEVGHESLEKSKPSEGMQKPPVLGDERKPSLAADEKVADFLPPEVSDISEEPKTDEKGPEIPTADAGEPKLATQRSEVQGEDRPPDSTDLESSDRETDAESHHTSLPPSPSKIGRADSDS